MADQLNAKARHANNASVLIGSETIGEATNVSVQEDSGLDPVHIVGTAYAVEHNHNRISVSVTISRIVFKIGVLNKYALGGASLLTLPPFDLHAYDKSTNGSLLFKVKDVSLGGRSLNLSANQRIGSDLRGSGIMLVATDGAGNALADSTPPTGTPGAPGGPPVGGPVTA